MENNAGKEVIGCTGGSCDDCDHQKWAGRGLAYGNGAFTLIWGWGTPGAIMRSTDGVSWARAANDESRTASDIAYANGTFMTGSSMPLVSRDGGASWSRVNMPLGFNPFGTLIRAIAPARGVFFLYGDNNHLLSIRSSDLQVGFPARPSECTAKQLGLADNGSVMVSLHQSGHICRSIDAGASWSSQPISSSAGDYGGGIFWDGSKFIFWSGGTRAHISTDGMAWSTINTSSAQSLPRAFGPIARSAAGAYVAVNGGWQVWYEKQQFFRSDDGIVWNSLPPRAFVPSHPINWIESGFVSRSQAGCP